MSNRCESIGLTGGIGSGKSTVAAMLAERGGFRIDADAISRQLTAPHGAAMPAIEKVFGRGVVDSGGGLDRTAMRARVFSNPVERVRLEDILHPQVRTRILEQLATPEAARARFCVVEVPLLLETGGYRAVFRRIVAVDCPLAQQRERVVRRSGLRPEDVEAIIAAQLDRRLRLQLADEVMFNGGTPEDLRGQVERLLARLPVDGAARLSSG